MQIVTGSPAPLGWTRTEKGGNFAIFSSLKKRVILGIFLSGAEKPQLEVPMHFQENIWHIGIEGLPEGAAYAYRLENSERWLADPFALSPDTNEKWGDLHKQSTKALCTPSPSFDW